MVINSPGLQYEFHEAHQVSLSLATLNMSLLLTKFLHKHYSRSTIHFLKYGNCDGQAPILFYYLVSQGKKPLISVKNKPANLGSQGKYLNPTSVADFTPPYNMWQEYFQTGWIWAIKATVIYSDNYDAKKGICQVLKLSLVLFSLFFFPNYLPIITTFREFCNSDVTIIISILSIDQVTPNCTSAQLSYTHFHAFSELLLF